MIVSQFRKDAYVGFWIGLISFILFAGVTIYYVVDQFYYTAGTTNHTKAIIITLFICSFLVYMGLWLKRSATTITIDPVQKTIGFTNIFIKKTEVSLLGDLDGYIETVVTSGSHTEYKAYYILKDKKVNRKILGYYYSNMDELQEGLKPLAYLGFQKLGLEKRLNILFNRPIVK